MLTGGENVSPQKAMEYFTQGYYLEGTSRWFGKQAQKLGLQGPVTDQLVFANILNGLSPDGTQELCSRKIEAEDRRAAVDLTFSCPKSFSLTSLLGDDERLAAAKQRALDRVLGLIEKHCAHTRVTIDGQRQLVNTEALVIAMFDHVETRELDPHDHTHCLFMNMVETPKGKYYSHVNDAIVKNKKYWGMVFQHYLALEVQKLGYEVEWREHGQFEIKGYTEEQLMEFSKRRRQILAVVGPNSTWAEREKAWDATRDRKQKIDPEELKAKWREEAEALGLRIVQPKEPQPDLQPTAIDEQLVRDAVEHCSTWEVAFSIKELGKFILSVGKTYDITQLEQSLSETFGIDLNRTHNVADLEELLQKKAELIPLPEPGGLRFTTYAALERERQTIALMQQGQRTVEPIADAEPVQSYLTGTILNEGQRQAVLLAALTSDKYTLWQGGAGTGKTETLKVLKAILEDNGYLVRGFSNTSEAVKELKQKGGVESDTIAGLLHSKLPEQEQPKQYWIVDEGGQIGALDALRLMQRAEQERARVLFVGDVQQFSAVAAGNPFKSLQEEGIATAQILESVRQKNPDLKLAVDLIARGQVEQGFARLNATGKIIEGDTEWQKEQIVADYMQSPPEKRQNTLVLVGTHKERLELTQAIRDKQKLEGTLGKSAFVTQLDAKNKLSPTEKKYIQHFQVGDIVVPSRNYKRRQLEKGAAYEVVGKTKTHLSLKAADGTLRQSDTGFDKEIYTPNQIDIAVGDKLKWTKSDKKQGKSNGQEFMVTAIEGNKAQIQYLKENRAETIDLTKAQHLDYAIVNTTYSAQGKDADRVLISADFTVSKEWFYVAVSRAKHELKLYTESQESLLKLAQKSKVNEVALDLVRKIAKQQIVVEPVAKPTITPPVEQPKEPQRQHTITPPVKRREKHQHQPKVPSVKAPVRELLTPPNWLTSGKRVYCRDRGWAEVQSVSGAKLSLKLNNGDTHHLLGWSEAVSQQLIIPAPSRPFWQPEIDQAPPPDINPLHWREQVEDSVIHPGIAAKNFKSLEYDQVEQAHEAWEHLFYSDKLERSNTGRLTSGILKRFAHIESGGWWCSAGVDPRSFEDLLPGQKPQEKLWGCFKPDNPRENPEKPGKKIKYEHPLKTDLSIFLLAVPDEIANRIYEQAGVTPSQSDRASGFWYCVWKHNLPVTITEGAKKAASLLSQGHAAIGLPGIYAGYRSKDEQGNEIKARLHDELAVFATPGREINICFDFETRPKTKRNIDIAISRTGSLLEKRGIEVKVVTLPGPDKGVDDYIKNQGPLAYEQQVIEALPLKTWRQVNKEQYSQLPISEQSYTQSWKEQLKAKWNHRLTTQAFVALDGEKLGQTIAQQLETSNKPRVKSKIITGTIPAQPIKPPRLHCPMILLPKKENSKSQPLDAQIAEDRYQKRQLNRLKRQQGNADLSTDLVLSAINGISAQPEPLKLDINQQEIIHEDTKLDWELFSQIDAASLGQTIAEQVEAELSKDLDQRHTISSSVQETRPVTNPALSRPDTSKSPLPLTSAAPTVNSLLDDVINSDRQLQQQLDQLEQQQQKVTSRAANALEEIEQLNSLDEPVASFQELHQVTIDPETSLTTQEITDDELQTLDTELFSGIDGASLGESVARSLEASDHQTEPNRGEIGHSNRTNHSLETNKPFNQSIVQPRANANQPGLRLPIPTGEPTEATRFFSAESQPDRRHQKQLEQINRSQRTADQATDSAIARIGSSDQGQSEADATSQRAITSARAVEGLARARQNLKPPGQAVPNLPDSSTINSSLTEAKPTVFRQTQRPTLKIYTDASCQPPAADKPNWHNIRHFLVEQLGMSDNLLDSLHHQRLIYADEEQNLVFVHKSLEGKVTGVELYERQLEGLVAKEGETEGWFAFLQGQGKLEQVVLVESHLSALAAATLSQASGATMFIVAERDGGVPMNHLRQYLASGGQVQVSYSTTTASKQAAQQLSEALPGSVRVRPSYGQDWTEQLLRQATLIAELNQLGDREFLLLYHNVDKYFKSAPPQAPPIKEKQLIESEIEKLSDAINTLWSKQTEQVKLVEGFQAQLLGTWNKKYEDATAELDSKMKAISQLVLQKDSQEQQLRKWVEVDEAFKAWVRNPRTTQMQEIADILKLTQVQKRFDTVQSNWEQQRQKQRDNLEQQHKQRRRH